MRAARLFDELQIAHGDDSFARRIAALAKLDPLVSDDFAISTIGPVHDAAAASASRIDRASSMVDNSA